MKVQITTGTILTISIGTSLIASTRKLACLYGDSQWALCKTIEIDGVEIPSDNQPYHLVKSEVSLVERPTRIFDDYIGGMQGWCVTRVEYPVVDYDEDDVGCV